MVHNPGNRRGHPVSPQTQATEGESGCLRPHSAKSTSDPGGGLQGNRKRGWKSSMTSCDRGWGYRDIEKAMTVEGTSEKSTQRPRLFSLNLPSLLTYVYLGFMALSSSFYKCFSLLVQYGFRTPKVQRLVGQNRRGSLPAGKRPFHTTCRPTSHLWL